MKILLSTFFYKGDFAGFKTHFFYYLLDSLPKDKIETYILLLENFYIEENIKYCQDKNVKPILIKNEDIDYVFNKINITISEIYKKIHKFGLTIEEKKRLKNLIKAKLGNWEPDITFSFDYMSGESVFGDIYSNALNLTVANGVFSRFPFVRVRNFVLEMADIIHTSSLIKFKNEITNYKITEKEEQIIENFKKYLTRIINKNSDISKQLLHYKKKYKKLLLLPLVPSYCLELFEDGVASNEYDVVEYVFSRIPKDIGVVVTRSDISTSITQKEMKLLKKKYPNLISIPNRTKSRFYADSLYYFDSVDAVLNLTSKTGYLAMLWDKPIISLTKVFNNLIKDGQGLEDLEKVLNTPIRNKNNILYWYLTHYVVTESNVFTPNFLYNYLEEKIEKYRASGITFDYYNQINDIETIEKTVCLNVSNNYKNNSKRNNLMRFINLFKKIYLE